MDKTHLNQLQLLSAAALGDSHYGTVVKAFILQKKPYLKPHALHETFSQYASAKFQSEVLVELLQLDILNEEESDVINRAQNKTISTKAKNASREEYRNASALEALIGVLYLQGAEDRLAIVMTKIIEKCGESI